MTAGRKYAQKLCWLDIETTNLPKGNNWDDVSVLEIAVVVTDFALNKEAGMQAVVKITPEAAEQLRANPEVLKMHQENDLIKESIVATQTLAEVEQEIIELLRGTGLDEGEFMIAGSGVATFDLQLIKDKMPLFAKWLAYYPFDVGVLRRTVKILNGNRDLVPIVKESFQEGVKKHRALDDVLAHLREAENYQTYFGGVKDENGNPWTND